MEAERNVMDKEIFEQFTEQLQRYVHERLIAAEKEILETDVIPDAIMAEMRTRLVWPYRSGRIWWRWHEHSAVYPCGA